VQITRIRVKNFRSIREQEFQLDPTTVFIGPNNCGKSAILDAIRIALTRRWGLRGTGFEEFDVHRIDERTNPRTADPVSIELMFEEPETPRWDPEMIADLEDITAIGSNGRNLITLRVSCAWNEETERYKPEWQFLDADGNGLTGRAQRATNLSSFFNYVPLFWLGPLRDASSEFTPRSVHWGQILKDIRIPDELEAEVKTALDGLDGKLLEADSRLGNIAETLGQATTIAVGEGPGAAQLRMLPLNSAELLSRAEVILRNEELRPWLPLGSHGQGLQSLSVIFLFQASALQRLATQELAGSEAVFAIEEPEVHLHPQAARSLWTRVSKLPGQRLITSHSPYFVQSVPLHQIRLVRLEGGETKLRWIPRYISSSIPCTEHVQKLIDKFPSILARDASTDNLAARATVPPGLAGAIKRCYRKHEDADAIGDLVDEWMHECRTLVSEEDEQTLNTLSRRVRGEMFFARRWLLVEGPSEYLLVHELGRALGYELDTHGISVIDFRNNGHLGAYCSLAEAFGIPWFVLVDGDKAKEYRKEIIKRGFVENDLQNRLAALSEPNLEEQLLKDGHEHRLRSILKSLDFRDALTMPVDEFKKCLGNKKTTYMAVLVKEISDDPGLAEQMPAPFVQMIRNLKENRG